MTAVAELGQITGVTTACQVLNVPRSSYYRVWRGASHPEHKAPVRSNRGNDSRRKRYRALSDKERDRVRNVLNSERFQDQSPRQVYAALLDQGEYLCHWRTMYRVLTRTYPIFMGSVWAGSRNRTLIYHY